MPLEHPTFTSSAASASAQHVRGTYMVPIHLGSKSSEPFRPLTLLDDVAEGILSKILDYRWATRTLPSRADDHGTELQL